MAAKVVILSLFGTNFRPTSLLAMLSKIIEKIMNKRLLDFSQKSAFFHLNQYGLEKNNSSETAVLDIIPDVQIQ